MLNYKHLEMTNKNGTFYYLSRALFKINYTNFTFTITTNKLCVNSNFPNKFYFSEALYKKIVFKSRRLAVRI